ncbi:dicarboxylate/amino acid:cation symporter [Mangrovibacterium marinum]|uniref:Na+/H+-dicarboxylate symporter n=1 Tax=Mangrovibacterium marinum TaxID=1639118 RepID=A0A2T5BZP2_9BACT|nr:dicarboxylate/amino acid:cation symporter [Mangrovibacterium marinum]PTN07755.1 Na+/H+-dicarboxylate symporter [Mangrovibacterium marinum]
MFLVKLKLHWQILIALVLAVVIGYYGGENVKYVAWMGDIFLRLLKMIIIPLIFSSIVSGVTSMGGSKNLGRLGIKTLGYYLTTSLLAIVTGLFLVNLIQPGKGAELGLQQSATAFEQQDPSQLSNIFMRMIPENIFQSLFKGDILSIIFFAVMFGFFINAAKTKYQQSLVTFFDSIFEVMMKMTLFIIRFTPLGILGIVAIEVSKNADQLTDIAGSMAIYMLTVVLALSIHAFITLPVLMKFIGKAKPYKHLKNMVSPLLTAFSTSSSSATLPLTIEAVENDSGVSNKITSFTLPLGATINMDGTALYECVAAMFIAQVYGIDLSFSQQVVVVVTALLASIGAAGIPMAGLVMITIILSAVHLPLEGVGLILAVDRILDMYRTSINVWSDSCGAVIIAKSEGEKTNI